MDHAEMAGARDGELRIKKLDNGGFTISMAVKKKGTKEHEYPWEDKTYGYVSKIELIKALSTDFFGGESKEKDALSEE